MGANPGSGRRIGRGAWVAVWAIACFVGLAAIGGFENRPGDPGRAVPTWPAQSSIVRATDRATLLLFAHPLCPCTRATLAELERVVAACADRIDARVVFSWEGSESPGDELGLIAKARDIAHVSVVDDLGGREARRFGIATSGEVLLYEPDGTLAWRGGITASRGHEGDSEGKSALIARILDGTPARGTFPVFGCPLFSETRATPPAPAAPEASR